MTIKRSQEGHWGYFPYAPNFTGDRTNNGGIDLTKEPHRIDEIHELNETPNLKTAIKLLNSQESPFMTTGFLSERSEDGLYYGYIEYCFKPGINIEGVDIENLDQAFLQYALTKHGQQFADFYQKEFLWEIHEGSVQGSPPIPVFSTYYRARSPQEVEAELLPLLAWLQTDFQYLLA